MKTICVATVLPSALVTRYGRGCVAMLLLSALKTQVGANFRAWGKKGLFLTETVFKAGVAGPLSRCPSHHRHQPHQPTNQLFALQCCRVVQQRTHACAAGSPKSLQMMFQSTIALFWTTVLLMQQGVACSMGARCVNWFRQGPTSPALR